MPQTVAQHRRNTIYNHPKSQAERAVKTRGPVAILQDRHRAEATELGRRSRNETLALNHKHTMAREKFEFRNAGGESTAVTKARKEEIAGLRASHDRESGEMGARHRRELERRRSAIGPDEDAGGHE